MGPRYQNWHRRKIREKQVYPANMQIGTAYLFVYDVDLAKDKTHTPLDVAPLAIVTRARSGGLMAINLLDIKNVFRRNMVVNMFIDAVSSPMAAVRMKKLLQLESVIKSDRRIAGAFKYYSRSRIKGRIVQVTPEELKSLVKDRIIDV